MDEKSNKQLNEVLEEMMLEEYYLLTKRIKGIGLSLHDYWESDSHQIGYLYQLEQKTIEYETKEYERMELETGSKSKTGKKVPKKYNDNEDLDDIYNSFSE